MVYVMYKDGAGEWRWRLFAGNNKILADSGEGYTHKQDCLAAINLVKASYNAHVQSRD